MYPGHLGIGYGSGNIYIQVYSPKADRNKQKTTYKRKTEFKNLRVGAALDPESVAVENF